MRTFFWICVIITIIILLYCFIFRKWLFRKFKFTMIIGKPGAGKTSLMVKDCMKWKKRKNHGPIYCNIELAIDGVRLFDPLDVSITRKFADNSLVLIDEPNLYWDNRSYKSIPKETIEWFRLYRHNKVNIRVYTQTYDIDKKLRKLVSDIFILKKYLGTMCICRRVDTSIEIKDSAMDAESQIVDQFAYIPFFIPGATKFTWLPRYANGKYFDSFYMPSTEEMPYQLCSSSQISRSDHFNPEQRTTTPPAVPISK